MKVPKDQIVFDFDIFWKLENLVCSLLVGGNQHYGGRGGSRFD
jgi:hypothetical protein